MEWLFFVTKHSFMSKLSILKCIGILLTTPLVPAMMSILLLLLIGLLMWPTKSSPLRNGLRLLALAVPTFVLSITAFLMVENFTYTIFRTNSGSFQGTERYLYLCLFICLVMFSYKKLHRLASSPWWESNGHIALIFTGVLIFLSLGNAAFTYKTKNSLNIEKPNLSSPGAPLPNILVISADGLNASHMSSYGYKRQTTPNIDMILDKALVFENHFSNGNNSTSSIFALLSGKLPTRTKVIFPPDIFNGIHMYQHLPGILRNLGYHNALFGLRHYVDSYDLNMRDAFDFENGREEKMAQWTIIFPKSIQWAFASELFFLERTTDRIIEHLMHTFGIKDMGSPFLIVEFTGKKNDFDSKNISQLINFIDFSIQPFFAYVHLLSTHGHRFFSNNKLYSKGKNQEDSWMDDFYDDAILDFDSYVKEVIDHLRGSGRLEDTIFILTSDHPERKGMFQRIPLIIRFPHKRYKGRVFHNTQHIDIAPTILNYLGVDIPDWMEGDSLITENTDLPRRIIVSGAIAEGLHDPEGWFVITDYKAPFYSLGDEGGISVIIGHRWFFLSLKDGVMVSGNVEAYSTHLEKRVRQNEAIAKELLIDHLKSAGYDISSLYPQ